MLDTTAEFSSPVQRCRILAGPNAIGLFRGIVDDAGSSSVFVIADGTAYDFHGFRLRKALSGVARPSRTLVLPSGERVKSYKYQLQIQNWLLDGGADRGSILAGFGGGVICDVAGFAAATFMRGLRHILLPTTLVAQIDAAIGGKNGINLPLAKNVAGTIRQPISVIADSVFLETLKPRYLNEGLAELIKTALVRSRPLARLLDRRLQGPAEGQDGLVHEIVGMAIRLKLDIVRKDPLDTGLRGILNFGHTAGHAIEILRMRSRIGHGKAVACGMLIALELSRRLCSLDYQTFAWGRDSILGLYGPSPIPDVSADDLWEVMKRDKKRTMRQVRFVLLEAFAHPVVRAVTKREFAAALGAAVSGWSVKP